MYVRKIYRIINGGVLLVDPSEVIHYVILGFVLLGHVSKLVKKYIIYLILGEIIQKICSKNNRIRPCHGSNSRIKVV